jgi:hypothetical protein
MMTRGESRSPQRRRSNAVLTEGSERLMSGNVVNTPSPACMDTHEHMRLTCIGRPTRTVRTRWSNFPILAKNALMAASSLRSSCSPRTLSPPPRRLTASCSLGAFEDARITVAPSASAAWAAAKPNPVEPPTMTTVLPARGAMCMCDLPWRKSRGCFLRTVAGSVEWCVLCALQRVFIALELFRKAF